MESSRPRIPSRRETDTGTARVSEPPAPAGPPVDEGSSVRGAASQIVRDLDPREILSGGPGLPLGVLALMALAVQWDDYAIGVLLPEIRADFGFDLTFLLTLNAVMFVIIRLTAPVVGFFADRWKRVVMLRAGAIVSNLSSFVTASATGLPGLVAGRVTSGLGNAVYEPVGFPLLTDWYPSRTRGRIFAFLGVAGQVGIIAGTLLAGVLGQVFGWRLAVVALAVVATLVSLGTFLLREPVRGYQDRLEMGAPPPAAEREQPPVSWAESWRAAGGITTVRRLWYATPFLTAAGSVLLTIMGFYYAEEFGLGPQARGAIAALGGIVGLLGLLVAGPVADRLLAYKPGRVMTLLGALLVFQAVVVLVVAASPVVWLSVAITLPITFTGALFAPALYTLLSLTVPARIRGLGLQTIAPWQLAGYIFVPFLGVVADAYGLRTGLVVLAPLFCVGAAILGTSAHGVDRDIRAAKSAGLAEQEARDARERGQDKLLVCRDVEVHYGGVQVLFGIDLDVEEGEILALLGTNGSGKSTLLRAISGVHEASGGAIFYGGRDTTHRPPQENARDGIVMVPGGRAVFPSLTVAENLRVAAWLYRDDPPGVDERTEQVLTFFPVLRERWEERAGSLSGGEQQMLALGQAFLMQPRLLMIDELTLGLAPKVVEQLLEIVRAIHEGGTTVVLVEQSVNVALRVARRAVFLEKGLVTFEGPTADLLRRPDVVRSVFLGTAAAGHAPARRTETDHRDDAILRVEDIRVRFGGVLALDGASLEVEREEIVGIIGPNGAGKTTLFDVVTGFVPPEAGRVVLDTEDVTDLPPHLRARRGLGRAFQNARLFAALTTRENIVVALDGRERAPHPVLAAIRHPAARRAERRLRRRADELIDLLGLQAFADVPASELSIGTRRTLEIACQMASSPAVLLLDEPSSGLAQAETEELSSVLRSVVRETGCALVVVEHDIPLITRVSDRLVAMDLGRVIAAGPPADVTAHPDVVRSYLATSTNDLGV